MNNKTFYKSVVPQLFVITPLSAYTMHKHYINIYEYMNLWYVAIEENYIVIIIDIVS